MLPPKKKVIGGKEFTFKPMNPLHLSHVNVNVVRVLAPLLQGAEGLLDNVNSIEDILDEDGQVDLGKVNVNFKDLTSVLVGALAELDEVTQNRLILDTLKYVQVVLPNQGLVDLDSEMLIGMAFECDVDSMYAVMFEAWRFNRLTPFKALDPGGALGGLISGLTGGEKKPKNTGLKLEKSEPLETT